MIKHSSCLLLVILLILFSSCSNTDKNQPDGNAKEKKVLLIGIDGTRADILKEVPTPHIDSLIANGFLADKAQTRMPTVSGPGWSSMLTGVWSDKHGVKGNQFKNKNYEQYPDFLTRMEQVDSTYATFTATTWPPLAGTKSGGPLLSNSIDKKQRYSGDNLGYTPADSQAVKFSTKYLNDQDVDAAFVYLGTPDVVAHQLGALTEEYRQSIRRADKQVGQLMRALKSRPTYAQEDWLILMSTDHGHVDEGGHGGPSAIEKNIFVLASGPSVDVGAPSDSIFIVDVAATALQHIGIPVDKKWNLDGKSILPNNTENDHTNQ